MPVRDAGHVVTGGRNPWAYIYTIRGNAAQMATSFSGWRWFPAVLPPAKGRSSCCYGCATGVFRRSPLYLKIEGQSQTHRSRGCYLHRGVQSTAVFIAGIERGVVKGVSHRCGFRCGIIPWLHDSVEGCLFSPAIVDTFLEWLANNPRLQSVKEIDLHGRRRWYLENETDENAIGQALDGSIPTVESPVMPVIPSMTDADNRLKVSFVKFGE